MSRVIGTLTDVQNKDGQGDERSIGLVPYLADGPNRPSLVDRLIKMAQEAYTLKVEAGTYNPEFSKGVALFVAAGWNQKSMTYVASSEELRQLLNLKSEVVSTCRHVYLRSQ